jgi:hypothetical protein
LYWKVIGLMAKGQLLAMTAEASDGVRACTAGITTWRLTGSTVYLPFFLSDRRAAGRVKTHTSGKRRKYNSSTRHQTVYLQHHPFHDAQFSENISTRVAGV